MSIDIEPRRAVGGGGRGRGDVLSPLLPPSPPSPTSKDPNVLIVEHMIPPPSPTQVVAYAKKSVIARFIIAGSY